MADDSMRSRSTGTDAPATRRLRSLARLCSRAALMVPVTALLIVGATACHPQDDETARVMTGGEPSRGKVAIARYGCGSCHEIPGVSAASGLVGPPLHSIADRTYLAGHLPNTPQNMMRWIQDPQSADPGTAMPDMNVTGQDARDITAYLYTLRRGR